MREWLADLGSVVVRGLRLWVAYLPVLFVIALLGGAGRRGAIWLAMNASAVNSTLGWAVLVLGPLAMVASLIAMLHVLRPALPNLTGAGAARAATDAASGHERRLVDVLASVFVPFLALYASYGFLAEDRRNYLSRLINRVYFEDPDVISGVTVPDLGRTDVAPGLWLIALVIVAVVIRWALGRFEAKRHKRAYAFAGAYVEAFWLLAVATAFTQLIGSFWDWLAGRRAVSIVLDWWLTVMERLGPVAGPVDAVVAWVAGLIGNLDDLVIIPLAWLAVGAVVYGYKLAKPAKKPQPLNADGSERKNRWQRLPKPARRLVTEVAAPVVGDVTSRFSGLVAGLRTLALAGLGPMLVFALAFLLARRLEDLLHWLVRVAIGPLPIDDWLAVSSPVVTIIQAFTMTLTIALLAAGVDRMLTPTVRAELAADRTVAPESGDDVAPGAGQPSASSA